MTGSKRIPRRDQFLLQSFFFFNPLTTTWMPICPCLLNYEEKRTQELHIFSLNNTQCQEID